MCGRKSRTAPHDPAAHLEAGAAYRELGDIPNLIVEYNEAARLVKSGSSGIHYALGRELLVMDDLKGAAKAFRDALLTEPEDVECRYHLAFTLCRSGDHDGEVQALREAVRLEPTAGAWQDRFVAVRESITEAGEVVHGILNFQDLLQNYELGHRALASALAETGDLDGAMAEYRQAIGKNEKGHSQNKSPYACTPLLSILIERDPVKLIPELREAIRINPDLAATAVRVPSGSRARSFG